MGKEKSPDKFVLELMLRAAIRCGAIDPKGKSKEDILNEVRSFALNLPEDYKLIIQIDHTQTLLSYAKHFSDDNEIELACLLYATWTEHCLNSIIYLKLEEMQYEEQDIVNIIRDVPIRGKITWLLKLLGLNSIHKTHVGSIVNLFEARNSYVHYKWKGHDADSGDSNKDKYGNIIKHFPKTVRYLIDYEDTYTCQGTIKRAKKMCR